MSFSNSKRNFEALSLACPPFLHYMHTPSQSARTRLPITVLLAYQVILFPFLSVPPSICASRLPSHFPPPLWPVWLSQKRVPRRWGTSCGTGSQRAGRLHIRRCRDQMSCRNHAGLYCQVHRAKLLSGQSSPSQWHDRLRLLDNLKVRKYSEETGGLQEMAGGVLYTCEAVDGASPHVINGTRRQARITIQRQDLHLFKSKERANVCIRYTAFPLQNKVRRGNILCQGELTYLLSPKATILYIQPNPWTNLCEEDKIRKHDFCHCTSLDKSRYLQATDMG
jgi:hypothetical protein